MSLLSKKENTVSHLFEPITLRGLTIRNRMWIPPMCQYAVDTHDGMANDWHLVHLGSLARGGAGAIIVEAIGVTPEGRITPHDLGLWNDDQAKALVRVIDFMHSQGAAAGVQLGHAGRKASVAPGWGSPYEGMLSAEDGGWTTVGPSPIAYPGLDLPVPLDLREIQEIVTAFADAANRAVRAGFDFVEIHGAHGYLIHEFLSPLSNQRTDTYGGTLENRARLLLEITEAIRARIPDSTPLLVRLSATDWLDGGVTIEETIQVVQWLRERGTDLIDVSTGANLPVSIPIGPGYQVPFATAIKNASDAPVATVGLITDPIQAEHILTTDQADVVLIGREALRDPHFPLRAAQALGHDVSYVPGPYIRAYS